VDLGLFRYAPWGILYDLIEVQALSTWGRDWFSLGVSQALFENHPGSL
jgi:hypothetical protein